MSTTTTTITATTEGAASLLHRIETIAHSAMGSIDGRIMLSQAHCVDVLLDLYSASDDPELRCSISERIDELRHVNMVLADDLRADLEAITAIAAQRHFLDLDWAEALLAEPCRGPEPPPGRRVPPRAVDDATTAPTAMPTAGSVFSTGWTS